MQILYLFIIIVFILGVVILSYILKSSKFTKDFSEDTFVIQLRNGVIHKTFKGGKIKFLPIIDDLITIPLLEQQTNVEIRNNNISEEKRFKIQAVMYWFVKDPVNSYSMLEWDPENANYAEKIIKDITETKLKLNCLDRTYDYIINYKNEFISTSLLQISEFLGSFSIGVNSITITKIEKF